MILIFNTCNHFINIFTMFLSKDPSILECAWVELLENNKSVTAEELAEVHFHSSKFAMFFTSPMFNKYSYQLFQIIYGSRDPLESYCAHHLLSRDDIYFNMMETKGFCSVYEPRPSIQVCF